LTGAASAADDAPVATTQALNDAELARFAQRAGERWTLETAIVGGARVDDERGVVPQRERGPEFVVLLVSSSFDGVPWLERVHEAAGLWDAGAMGAPAEIHCYTPDEYPRKREHLQVVRWTAERGVPITDM
jgi:hypothetical protein